MKKKVDRNQAELVKQIRQIPGTTVTHLHEIGKGVPDILVGFEGSNYLIEIKDPMQPPSKKKLTPDEEIFHKQWTGQVCVAETIDDVLHLLDILPWAQ